METTIGAMTGAGQHRPLGAAAAAGGIIYLLLGVVLARAGEDTPRAIELFAAIWALGCLCGLVGIGLLGAAGRGVVGRLALAVAALAYAVAALDALLIAVGTYRGPDSPLFAVSRLGTLVGMVLVGIATVAARRWPGWRRFAPFALPLALPVAIAFSASTGIAAIVPFIGLAWALIGYAIWSTPAPS